VSERANAIRVRELSCLPLEIASPPLLEMLDAAGTVLRCYPVLYLVKSWFQDPYPCRVEFLAVERSEV
jgi:hypothetical protein